MVTTHWLGVARQWVGDPSSLAPAATAINDNEPVDADLPRAIPTWGRHIALASVALIIVGAATLAAGARHRHFRDSVSGGVYGDASGLNTHYGGPHDHGGHEGGHGADSGH